MYSRRVFTSVPPVGHKKYILTIQLNKIPFMLPLPPEGHIGSLELIEAFDSDLGHSFDHQTNRLHTCVIKHTHWCT